MEEGPRLNKFFGSSRNAQTGGLISHFESIFTALGVPWSVEHVDPDTGMPRWKIVSRVGDIRVGLSDHAANHKKSITFFHTLDSTLSVEDFDDRDGYSRYLEMLMLGNAWGRGSCFSLWAVDTDEEESSIFELVVQCRLPAGDLTQQEVENALADVLERVAWFTGIDVDPEEALTESGQLDQS